jgi:uncharacterized protein YndB with AHSA1/START domain
MTNATQAEAIRFEITVDAPVDRAFAVFTEQFDQIKPREHNLLAPEPIAETVFEPHVGGYVFDRGENGSVCRWARVLAFEPPNGFVISWDISPTWSLESDPTRTSEVEVRFSPKGENRTRVELEHRNFDRHGEGWESVRDGVASGWPLYLKRYVALVSGR